MIGLSLGSGKAESCRRPIVLAYQLVNWFDQKLAQEKQIT